jgi:hypothetical protein
MNKDTKGNHPEPHAVVLVNGDQRTIPLTDLEAVNESR